MIQRKFLSFIAISFTMNIFVHDLQLYLLFLQHSDDSFLWSLGSLDNKRLFKIKHLDIK